MLGDYMWVFGGFSFNSKPFDNLVRYLHCIGCVLVHTVNVVEKINHVKKMWHNLFNFTCLLNALDNKFDCLILKHANGLDSRKGIHLKNLSSFVIMIICRDCMEVKSSHFYSLCLENGVMMTPKRWLLTLIFACLWHNYFIVYYCLAWLKTHMYMYM